MNNISDNPFGYPKDISERCLEFQKELFRISKLAVLYVCVLEIRNVVDFLSLYFGYYTSDIVSDIRKALRICCDASPNLFSASIKLCMFASIPNHANS